MDPMMEFARRAASLDPDLAELALLVSACHRDAQGDSLLYLDEELARIDHLAREFGGGSASDLITWMHRYGFVPNTDDYYDLRNSMLDVVIERRTGIPITLSILAIEIGRRVGIELVGIGLPGEFIVRERDDPEGFHNPFRHSSFGLEGVTSLVAHFGGHDFGPDRLMLEPVPTVRIIERVLSNVVHIAAKLEDDVTLMWALRLQTLLPSCHPESLRRLAGVMVRSGRFWEAAEALERSVELRSGEQWSDLAGAEVIRSDIAALARLRAGLN